MTLVTVLGDQTVRQAYLVQLVIAACDPDGGRALMLTMTARGEASVWNGVKFPSSSALGTRLSTVCVSGGSSLIGAAGRLRMNPIPKFLVMGMAFSEGDQ